MNGEPDPSDRFLGLLERWRGGDRSALDTLLIELQPWLRQEISKKLATNRRGAQDSIDVAQTAVANFLEWGPRFVPASPAQLRALLLRIAINDIIDHDRREARGGARHLDSLVDSQNPLSGFSAAARSGSRPGRALERSEDEQWVRLALQFLEEDDRYLLLASEVESLDWATIASQLGMATADAARMRASRIKPKLARMMLQLRRGAMPSDV